MLNTLADFRALDRRVFTLSAARMVATSAFSMVLPLMAVHLSTDRGVPVPVVGAILTLAGVCGALTQYFAGVVCDRTGRVPLLIGASVLRTAVLPALGVAIGARAPVSVIALLMIVNSVSRGLFDPPAQALVADLAPPDRRVSAFALQRIGVNIGFTSGAAVGAWASGIGVPYPEVFYWSLPGSVLATIAVFMLRDVPHPTPPATGLVGWKSLAAQARDRAFMRFLLATFVFFALQVQLFVTLPMFASGHLGLPKSEVMSIFVVNGILVVLLQVPAASFINRIGRTRALVLGSLGYALGYATVATARGLATVLLSVAVVTLAEVVLSPAQHTQVTTMAPPGRIGTYAGLFGLCQIAGQSLGPLLGTSVLAVAPARLSWIILGVLGVAAAWWYRPPPASDDLSKARG